MQRRRVFRLVLVVSLTAAVLIGVLGVWPARSAVPHLGYGFNVGDVGADALTLLQMQFNWIKIFDVPGTTLPQSVLLRVDVTSTTTVASLLNDLDNKLNYLTANHLAVQAWEIGNEPNIDADYGWGTTPDPVAYKNLLCAAYAHIKAARPDAIVVSAGLAPTGRVITVPPHPDGNDGQKQDERKYLQQMLAAGGGTCLDAVGYHPYGYSADYNAVPDVVSGDPTQNCDQGFCFRGAEKIYAVMQNAGIGDKKVWATEFGWITAPANLDCLNDPSWAGRQWQIVTEDKRAANLVGAYQYADDNWPWMGAMFVFNLDFNQLPNLGACDQMRSYDVRDTPAQTALTNMAKNAASIPGKLKTDVSNLAYSFELVDQPLTVTLDLGLSNWGWEPAYYTATANGGAAVVPVILNPTGVLAGTEQRTLALRIANIDRTAGTHTGQVTVNWSAYGVNNPTPRVVNLTLAVSDTVGLLRVSNSSPTPLGQSTAFTAKLSSATAYQWSFGDGKVGGGATPTHTYQTVGVYTAQVTATNSLTTVIASLPVTITDAPITGLYISASPNPTPPGETTVFTANLASGSNVSYQWNFGDGQLGSGETLTHTYAITGLYRVILTGTNSIGAVAVGGAVWVTDQPLNYIYLPIMRR